MNELLGRVIALAERQHDVVAVWQLRQMGWSSADIHRALRHLRKVHRGVRAVGDLTEEGWYMAAALAGGLYRAIEEADRRAFPLDRTHLLNDVVHIKQRIKGTTRSDTEAAFILFCHDHGLPLPQVNQDLNGFEHHRQRSQFNTDRLRGLVHRAHGWELVRVSADHVYDQPELLLDALTAGRLAV